jgi:hypothetical protein
VKMDKPLAPLEVRVMKKHKSKWESRMMTFSGREIRWEGKKEKKTLPVSAVVRVAESSAAPNSLMKNCGLTLDLAGGKVYTIACVSERQKKEVVKQIAEMKAALEREVKEVRQKELDEKRRADDERKRIEFEARKAEERRRVEDEKRRIEDAKRDELRKVDELQRRRADEERRKVDEERRRVEEAKREETRRAEEVQKRRLDEERRRADEERKKLDERRRVEEARRAAAAAEAAARVEREREAREEVEQARIAAQVQTLRQETQNRERLAREERERVAREQKEAAQEAERERLAREQEKALLEKALPLVSPREDKERLSRELERNRLRKVEEERRESERQRLRNLDGLKLSAARLLGRDVSSAPVPAVAAVVGSPLVARSPPRKPVEAPAMLSVTIPLTISPKSPFNPTAKLGGENGVNFQHIRSECNCLVDIVLVNGGELALRLDARTPGDLAAGERLGRSLVEAVEKQFQEWSAPPPPTKRVIPDRVLSAKRESVPVSYDSLDLPASAWDSNASTIPLDEYPTEIVDLEPPVPSGRPREMTTGLDGILENLLPGERLRASQMVSMEDLEQDAEELQRMMRADSSAAALVQKESLSVIEVEDLQEEMERELHERMDTEYEF